MYKRNNSWCSDFIHEGRRYTCSWGEITKTVAKEKDQRFRTDVKEGKYRQQAKRVTFNTFKDTYLTNAKLNKRPASVTRNEVSIKALMPHFKGVPLKKIYPDAVEAFKAARIAEKKTPATVNRDVATLKNMMTKAVEWGYLPFNPLAGVKLLKEDNEKMWVLTVKEEERLLAQCAKRPQKKTYLEDLVLFALGTGMREKEIFGLKKIHMHLDAGYVLLTDTKTHENRTVPANDTVRTVIKRQLKNNESDYIFCNHKGQGLTVLTNAFWRAVKDAGLIREEERAGMKKSIRFRFHDLRHTFGSRLGMAGFDLSRNS